MDKWKKIKKSWLVAAVTGAVVVGAGIAVLVGASGRHAVFEPRDYEDFENQYENSGEYDSAAGDGEESDLANENEDGEDSADEDSQKALKMAHEEPEAQDDANHLGMAEDQDRGEESGQEVNPDAFELTDDRGADAIDVRPVVGLPNGNTSGGLPGNGPGPGAGATPTPAPPQQPGTQEPTQPPSPTGMPGSTPTPDPSSGPAHTETPGPEPTNGPEVSPTPTPTERPPRPTATPSTWEDEQLKPKDPVETKDGVLVRLTAVIHRKYYQGDVFQAEDAQVTATFRQSDGTRKDRTLAYGGADGYSVHLSTKTVGTYTATFTYLKVTARAQYEVISSGVSVRYQGEKDGEIYAVNFPGPLGGDPETMDKISGREFHATSGGRVDLTDIHSRMIAYLGDKKIQKNFLETVTYQNTTFLEEQDGYLKNMLCGFRYYLNGSLEENGPYLYYPVHNWGANNLRNVVNMVADVPEGYKIRRTVQNEADLEKYRAEQVLEQYEGEASVLTAPMGVTKIALKGRQGNGNVTSMVLPESVGQIDVASAAQCLPKLENYETSGPGVYQAAGGLLYSRDGKKLISVPAGRTQAKLPETVAVIGKNAFKNSRVRRVDLPESVETLEEGCFEGLQADAIHIKGTRMPKNIADTGYTGKVLFQDSDYDICLKRGMFAFKDTDMTFGVMDENGAEIPEKTGLCRYDEERRILVYADQPEKLAGIPLDTYGRYAVSEGIAAIGANAFAGAEGLREVELPATVTELGAGSLVFSENAVEIFLSAEQVKISSEALGSPADGTARPQLKVYVPKEAYGSYLEQWSKTLDPVYGEGTAARLLQADDDEYIYEGQARYRRVVEGQRQTYCLVKVYAQDQTVFQVKEGTTAIEAKAFALCGSLEILWLPDGLEEVADDAFAGCQALRTVTAKSAQIFPEKAFDGAAQDVQIYEKGGDFTEFICAEGPLYGKMADGSYTLLDAPTDCAGEIVLRENTSRLHKEAFRDCARLESLRIPDPDALREIGAGCFENCASLRQMHLEKAARLQTVGAEAFRGCESLTELRLPDALKKGEKGLCYGCISLETVQAGGIGQVGEEMFFNCQSLTSDGLTLDWQALTKVDSRAFARCSLLTAFPDMPALVSLGEQTFFACQRLRRMVLPESLTSMGEECFGECSALAQVTLNGKLTGISRYCFYGCHGLARVEFGPQQKAALQVVGVQAFSQCISLESLDLSGFPALRQMGERTFAGCDLLTSVRLPENLSKIPDYCFESCPNLSILELSSRQPPAFGASVFGESLSPFLHLWVKEESLPAYKKTCQSVLDPVYGAGTTEAILGKIDEKTEIVRGIVFEITEEGRVLKEASEAFEGDYVVPIDTVRIASEAFLNCAKLTGIQLPWDSSISLGDSCFKGCSGLKTVELYGEIPQWGEEAFMDCAALERASIGGSRSVDIPKVGDRAFKNCTGLVGRDSVTMQASVTVLGKECFAGCVNLEAIPSSSSLRASLEAVEERAFEGCASLTQFLTSAFTGLKSVGAYAFCDCGSLSNPSIPANVTAIGEGLFAGCGGLKTVSFYCVLEEYPKDCFKDCPQLTRTGGVSAALAGLKRIGEGAYDGCVSLTSNSSWNLGRYTGLEEIGDHAFRGCTDLDAIRLGPAVGKIGADAFDGCVKVKQMTFDAPQPPQMGRFSLDGFASDFQIRVPDSQTQEDAIYKAYLHVFSEMFGSGRAYEILDSISDGAKDRNDPAALAKDAPSVSSGEKETSPAKEHLKEEKRKEEPQKEGPEEEQSKEERPKEKQPLEEEKDTDPENMKDMDGEAEPEEPIIMEENKTHESGGGEGSDAQTEEAIQ